MTKPTVLPDWAATGPVETPSAGLKSTGFYSGQRLPAEFLNWLFHHLGLWAEWLNAFEDTAHVWTALQTFQASVSVNELYSSDNIQAGVNLLLGGTTNMDAKAALFLGGSNELNIKVGSEDQPIIWMGVHGGTAVEMGRLAPTGMSIGTTGANVNLVLRGNLTLPTSLTRLISRNAVHAEGILDLTSPPGADGVVSHTNSHGIASAMCYGDNIAAWQSDHDYLVGQFCTNDSKVYRVFQAGHSAASGGPTGTIPLILDGSLFWAYVAPLNNFLIVVTLTTPLATACVPTLTLITTTTGETTVPFLYSTDANGFVAFLSGPTDVAGGAAFKLAFQVTGLPFGQT